MKRNVLYGWLAGVSGIAVLMAFGYHQINDSFNVCEDVIMQEALSPDAHLKAVVYNRSCGVFSTGLTTQVTIVKEGDSLPKELGNVYVERSESSQPQVWVQWQGSHSLLVKDDPKVLGRDASEAEKRVKVNLGWFRSANVTIRYANIAGQEVTK